MMKKFTVEQSQAIETLDRNVAVSAGAGAGKTRVLVERYLNIIVQEKAVCEEIIAITFTKKAAKEMRERIRSDLEHRLGEVTGDKWFYWNDLKNRLEYASITTFHSLCGRILREHPVEARLDPNFTVLDDVEAKLLMKEALDETILAAATKQEDWLRKLLHEYNLAAIKHDFASLYDEIDSVDWFGPRLTEYFIQPYKEVVESVPCKKQKLKEKLTELAEYRLQLKSGSVAEKKLSALWAALPELVAAIEGTELVEDFQPVWDEHVTEKLKGIRLNGTMSEAKKELDHVFVDWRESLACEQTMKLMEPLATYFNALAEKMNQLKSDRQLVTFADLENATLRLLKSHPELCQMYNRKYRYIMVDEFQDTNERQKELIYLLAGGNSRELKGQKLFVVGDPKQSIYRFRGADVEVFEQVEQDILASGGICISLDQNFRSQKGLISLCNEVFTQLFQGDESVTFSPIQGNKGCDERQDYAEWLVLSKEEIAPEESTRSAEATMIAKRLQQMVTQKERLVFDEETQKLLPVQYGHMAILLRSFTDVALYETALHQNGVPYYVVGGRGFYTRQEILDVLALLRVIDNCYDDLAWVGVLRSPLFLLTDVMIAALKAGSRPIWVGLQELDLCSSLTSKQRTLCRNALFVMNELREAKDFLPLPELVEQALKLTHYREFLLSQFMGKQQVANVEKLVALAVQQSEQGQQLHDFLVYIDDILEEDVKEGEAQIESEAGDTVKILTIHKAKGLEYPVVILPDLQRKFVTSNNKALFNSNLGLGLSTAGCIFGENRVFSALKKQNQECERLELKRVLYVAQTRAKDYLVLSSVAEDTTEKDYSEKNYVDLDSWHKWLSKLAGSRSFTATVWQNSEEVSRQCGQRETAAIESEEVLPAYVDQHLLAMDKCSRDFPVFSASMLSRYHVCPRAYYYHYIAHIPEFDTPSFSMTKVSDLGTYPNDFNTAVKNLQPISSAKLLGTVVHKFAELYQSGSVESTLDRALQKLMMAPMLCSEMRQAALPLCQTYSEDKLFDRKAVIYSEWPFTFALTDENGTRFYFRGMVDKILASSQGLQIIDLKTDQVLSADLIDKVDHYACQLQLYTLAAQKLLQQPVTQASLYFLRLGRLVPIPLLNEQEFLTSLLPLCRFLATHQEEADYVCNRKSCSECSYALFCT